MQKLKQKVGKYIVEFNQELYEVGARIIEQREKQGMTATQLAIQTGITAASLSHIESGQKAAKSSTLFDIAEVLKVSLDCLQPQKLEQFSPISAEKKELLLKLNKKTPAEQEMLIRMFSAMIDSL